MDVPCKVSSQAATLFDVPTKILADFIIIYDVYKSIDKIKSLSTSPVLQPQPVQPAPRPPRTAESA